MPAREADDAAVDRAAYYIALEGVTKHGLSEAVKAVLQGKLGHTFFPSPVELRMQCDKAMEWHVAMAERIAHRQRVEAERIPPRADPTPEALARQQAVYAKFCADHDNGKVEAEAAAIAAERADIRARYGMTDEVLAGVKDAPLPAGWTRPRPA